MLVLILFLIFFVVPLFIYLAIREQNQETSNGLLGVATFSAAGVYFWAADYFGFIYNPDNPNNVPMVFISFLIAGVLPMLIVSCYRRRE